MGEVRPRANNVCKSMTCFQNLLALQIAHCRQVHLAQSTAWHAWKVTNMSLDNPEYKLWQDACEVNGNAVYWLRELQSEFERRYERKRR